MRIGIRLKILISFLICSIVAMLIAMGGTYWRFKKIMTDNVSNEISKVLLEQKNSINNLLKKISDCGELIGVNEVIIKSAYSDKDGSIKHQYDLTTFSREINNIYDLSIDSEFGEYGLNFFVNEKIPIASELLDSGFSTNVSFRGIYSTKGLSDQDWYKKTLEKNGDLYLFTNDNPEMLFFARKIVFLNPATDDNFFGISVVGIDFERVLNNLEQKAITDDMKFAIAYNGAGVISRSRHLPTEVSLDVLMNDKKINSYSIQQILFGKHLAHATKTDSGITLMSFTSVEDIAELALTNKRIIVIPLLITLFLLIIMSLWLSAVLNKPIRSLVSQLDGLSDENMKKLEMKCVNNDEVGDLYYAINSLIDRVNTLLEKIKSSARRETELEIQMHQMKITPHFLYNTLDAVFWKAEMSGEKEIADMVSNLSSIFEYSIRGGKLTSTLSEEISILECYVEIQRKRYNNNIDFFYDIATLEDIEVPKNILQPLVENSIIHGMTEEKELEIFIWAQKEENKIEIHIQDNGKGNCAEELNAYLAGDDSILKGGKIGVSNVNKRLKFIYGEGSGLHYVNNPQGGLTVILFILQNETGS